MTSPVEIQCLYCPSCGIRMPKKLIEGRQRLFCSSCGFVFWNNPKPSVSAVLVRENKVFLLKRAHEPFKNYWVLPGGYIEYDEDPKSAIIREAHEETGFDILPDTIISAYLINTDPRGNSIDIVYSGKVTGGTLQLHEHTDGKFFSLNDLPSPIAYKHKEVIVAWFKKHKTHHIA